MVAPATVARVVGVVVRVGFAAVLLLVGLFIARWLGTAGWSRALTRAAIVVVLADLLCAWFLVERKRRRWRSRSARA